MAEVSGLDRRCEGQALEESAAPVTADAAPVTAELPLLHHSSKIKSHKEVT
jgi:hypothetical protein